MLEHTTTLHFLDISPNMWYASKTHLAILDILITSYIIYLKKHKRTFLPHWHFFIPSITFELDITELTLAIIFKSIVYRWNHLYKSNRKSLRKHFVHPKILLLYMLQPTKVFQHQKLTKLYTVILKQINKFIFLLSLQNLHTFIQQTLGP